MKVPLDFFLRLIQKFLNEIELTKLGEKIDAYLEMEEDDYADVIKGANLKDIIENYISSNEKLKKKLKAKVKQIEEAQQDEDDEEEEEKKVTKKKHKRSEKKTFANDDDEDEEEVKPVKKQKKEEKKKGKKEEDIDLNKIEFKPIVKEIENPDRLPFKRVDDSIKETLPDNLKDNSYEFFMKKTGDNFGHEANEKLKFTRGKDFKKEKGKFKNKSSAGTFAISTTVRSIPLDDDSD